MNLKLTHITHEFIKQFLKLSVFYIPEDLLNYARSLGINNLEKLQGLILFFTDDGNPYIYPDYSLPNFISKGLILNENIFYLYELKSITTQEQFAYIVDKYSELVDFFNYISYQLTLYIETTPNCIPKEVQQAFNIQCNFIQAHTNEFYAKFKPNQLTTTLSNPLTHRVQTSDYTIISTDIRENIVSLLPKTNIKEDKKTHLNTIKEKAKYEAEEYLLTKVFNVVL